MALYLLDTNVFAALSSAKPSRAKERAFTRHTGEIVTAAIVLHEMRFGIQRLPRSRRRTDLEAFLAEIRAPRSDEGIRRRIGETCAGIAAIPCDEGLHCEIVGKAHPDQAGTCVM